MFSSELILEILPLASVMVSIILSCLIFRIPLGKGIPFSIIAFVLSLFCPSPFVIVIITLNTLTPTPFLPELFSFKKMNSWNEWYQLISFEGTGEGGFGLFYLSILSLISISLAVYLTSNILGWHLPKSVRFFSSIVITTLSIFLAFIYFLGRLQSF